MKKITFFASVLLSSSMAFTSCSNDDIDSTQVELKKEKQRNSIIYTPIPKAVPYNPDNPVHDSLRIGFD